MKKVNEQERKQTLGSGEITFRRKWCTLSSISERTQATHIDTKTHNARKGTIGNFT